MNKFLIAGNWKMNKTTAQALHYVNELRSLQISKPEQAAIIAPFTQLAPLKEALKGTGILLGAQNVHYEHSGAYTGEISVDMLKEIGIDYCVIGHSERRAYYNETDEAVNRKIKVLLEAEITPILCVGESLETREEQKEQAFVCGQLDADFAGLTASQAEKVVVAYEPIWAIGTGKTATPEQAEEMCGFIRGMLGGLYDVDTADRMIIQYGGSMKPGNAEELLKKRDINGGLIGGASLKAKDFAEIVNIAAELAE